MNNDPANNWLSGLASNPQLKKMKQQMYMKFLYTYNKNVCCPDSTAFKIAGLMEGP